MYVFKCIYVLEQSTLLASRGANVPQARRANVPHTHVFLFNHTQLKNRKEEGPELTFIYLTRMSLKTCYMLMIELYVYLTAIHIELED